MLIMTAKVTVMVIATVTSVRAIVIGLVWIAKTNLGLLAFPTPKRCV